MTDRVNSLGETFEQWREGVDAVYVSTIGLGMDDLGDAPWYDYFADDMSEREAAACAMMDYQDVPEDVFAITGLDAYI